MRSWSTMGYILIAFACSLTLWFYVADYDRITEEEIKNVKVELILPSNENLSVESGLDNYITVKVSGRKADVEGMSAKDLHAFIDLSGIKEETSRAFEVQFEKLPNGVTVVNNRDIPKISVVLVESVIRDVPIKADIKHSITQPNFIETSCVPGSVKITGSASIVNSIATAEVYEDAGKIDGDCYVMGKIVLKDAGGNIIPQTYLDLDQTEAKVYIDVFTRKELAVDVKFTGGIYSAETSGAEIHCNPSTVTVVGPLKTLETKKNVEVEIDERDILGSDYVCSVELPDLSKYVNVEYANDAKEVEVSIRHTLITSAVLDISTDDISFINDEDFVVNVTGIRIDEESYGDTAQVMFIGLRESVDKLSLQKLDLELDLGALLENYEEPFEVGQIFTISDIVLERPDATVGDVFTPNEVYISLEISYDPMEGSLEEQSSEEELETATNAHNNEE
ncbi:MAG: hypothetical protein E7597_03745 [Ruminococcaceae bacterium]|nr:hypothetical protein [Oscillospiraceae bacterium]